MTRVLAVLLFLIVPAGAEHGHPSWMTTLSNAAGVNCCSVSDQNAIKDVDWETFSDPDGVHYQVHVLGGWVKVDDAAVVKAPNPYRVPILWYSVSDDGVFVIKCFLPGAGL